VDTALVKVDGRWGHRKSGGPPVESAGGIFSGTPWMRVWQQTDKLQGKSAGLTIVEVFICN